MVTSCSTGRPLLHLPTDTLSTITTITILITPCTITFTETLASYFNLADGTLHLIHKLLIEVHL